MKKKLMTLAVALSCAMIPTLFSSCVKDALEFKPEVTLPRDAEFEDGALLVPQWASKFNLEIETSGEWSIESDRLSLYPEPGEGKGNATVTVYVQENTSDGRKLGHLSIVFPGHEDQNKTITVKQAWYGDPVPNGADPISTSNKIYAVGFSYDCTGEYASPNSVKKEVFNTQVMIGDGTLAVNSVQASLTSTMVSGSTITELTNNLAVKANVSGGFGKFKAEAGASFDMNHLTNTNYEYASSYFDLSVRRASLNKDLETLKGSKKYMMEDARNAINGIPVEDDFGVMKVQYPSPSACEGSTEGFRNLIREYGTHVIVEAGLGGRIRHTMSVDISNIKRSYDINAYAQASYQGILTANGSVNEKFSNSYEEYKGSTKTDISVIGGDEKIAKALGTDSFTPENVKKWTDSVSEDNMALVSFGEKSLIPLYELVDRRATLTNGGFDGQKRYEELKDYIDGGCSEDFSSYECGTVTKIQVPSFADKQNGGTLIQDVWLGGQWVGQVCEEFLPLIDMNKRVTVVYPVLNNTVRYNMGFFIGDENHKPARVSWEGGDYRIIEYKDLKFGAVGTLCLRGASVSATPAPGADVKDGSLQDEYMEGYGWDGSQNAPYNYPIVKIFDQIWTRTSYKYDMASGYYNRVIGNERYVFYPASVANEADKSIYVEGHHVPFPFGWRSPREEDYSALITHLEDSKLKLANPGAALLQGGGTGFDVVFAGTYDYCYDSGPHLFHSEEEAEEWERNRKLNWDNGWRPSDTEMIFGVRGTSNNPRADARSFKISNQGAVSYGYLNYYGGDEYCIRLIKQ
jgi:hypothetical protein